MNRDKFGSIFWVNYSMSIKCSVDGKKFEKSVKLQGAIFLNVLIEHTNSTEYVAVLPPNHRPCNEFTAATAVLIVGHFT